MKLLITTGNGNILSGNLMELKISQNGCAHRFQHTRIGKEQVFLFDLGFAVRYFFNLKILK